MNRDFQKIEDAIQDCMVRRDPKFFDLLGNILQLYCHESKSGGESYYSVMLFLDHPFPIKRVWIGYPIRATSILIDHIFDRKVQWDKAFREADSDGTVTCNMGTATDTWEMGSSFWTTIRCILAVRYYRLKVLHIPMSQGSGWKDLIGHRFGAPAFTGAEMGPGIPGNLTDILESMKGIGV